MVGHNGRLYVTAGDNAGAALGDVQTATLTTDTGIGGLLGPWAAGTGFPTGRWGHAAVAARGFVYVMSGVDSAPAFLTDVQFARLNPDGSLGAWAATTPMPLGRQLFAATEYNGAIYVSGGNAGSLNDVRRSHINANGTLGPWVFTGTFTTGRYGHATAASNGYFYIFGGASSTNVLLDDVQVARINPDGSLGAFTPVGTFPTARYNFGGFAHNGHLWVVGGALGMYGPMTTDVSAANIRPDGTLTAWVATRPLPTARGYHATIAYDGWLSVSGGYSGSFLSSSDSARILSDGTLEPWASNPPLPRAIGYQTPVADNGFVYLLGGSTGGTSAYNEIPVAPVLGPLAVAKYSRFIDLGMNSIVESITLTGDNGRGTARLATRTSLDAGTFGPMTTLREMPLGQAVPAPSTSRYVWLQVTLDDTRDAPGRSSGLERDLDDVTISLLLANGSSCVDTAECASGECTDGVCCDSACAGACDVCNAPLALGTCTVAGAGSTGSPSCSPYVCNGSTATCPPDCTGSTECVPTAYCTGGGLCVPKSANGVSCSSAASCASGHCIDGVCCDTTCGGACDACNLVGRIGVCSASGLGALGNPSCAPYTCTELSAACFSNCTTDAQCVASAYCSGETCVPKQANGASCSTGSACASGHCVDGVCCSGACGGACDACDVAGFVGTCTFSPVGSPGAPSCSPLSCTGNLTNCPTTCADDSNCLAGQYCELGVCQGRLVDGASCTAAKQCVGDLCIDGVCCNALCDGACDACNLSGSIGTCTVLPMGSPSSCAPFVCAGSAACPTACTDDTNCASGLVCKAGTCVEDGRRYRVGCGCSTGGEVFALLGSLVFFSRRRLHRRLLCR